MNIIVGTDKEALAGGPPMKPIPRRFRDGVRWVRAAGPEAGMTPQPTPANENTTLEDVFLRSAGDARVALRGPTAAPTYTPFEYPRAHPRGAKALKDEVLMEFLTALAFQIPANKVAVYFALDEEDAQEFMSPSPAYYNFRHVTYDGEALDPSPANLAITLMLNTPHNEDAFKDYAIKVQAEMNVVLETVQSHPALAYPAAREVLADRGLIDAGKMRRAYEEFLDAAA